MPKIWTWLVLVVSTVAVVSVVSHVTEPDRLAAQAGTTLTPPIPQVAKESRLGSVQNKIGWTHAKKRYQADMPVGRGIIAGQVEAMFRGGFMAKTGGKLPATGFVSESGIAAESGHATNVAASAFGTDSAGMGVREVRCWHTSDWLGSNFLKTGLLEPPLKHEARVYNHSWISKGGPTAPLVLRRVDYMVDEYDRLVVCGVNNGRGAVPALLASAYNVISVGKESGNNSDGLTTGEGPGRCKPELIAPGGTTSGATGVVTGCVAALLELADRKIAEDPEGRNKDAARSELIKAVLLAGARRTNKWTPPEGEPLDRARGAGMVDLDRSLVMLDAGHVEPDGQADMRNRYGWSFAQIKPGQTRSYSFTLDTDQAMTGIALTWNRKVIGGKAKLKNSETGEERLIWNSSHFTPNLDLELVRHIDDQTTEPVAISASKVDNVELIHLWKLDRGRYTLRVKRAADDSKMDWDYALAWRIEAKQ